MKLKVEKAKFNCTHNPSDILNFFHFCLDREGHSEAIEIFKEKL